MEEMIWKSMREIEETGVGKMTGCQYGCQYG